MLRRALVLRVDGLGQRVVRGAGYQFLGIGLRTSLTLVSTAILARLLTPADFGYVAMASVVTEFAALISAFGLSNVLIQRGIINRLQLDTVFWATLGIGCALTAFVCAASFVAGWMFSDPHVGPLLRLMSLNFALGSLSAVPAVLLSRLLWFRAMFWMGLSTIVVRSVVAIGCAALGWGMWSLVIGSLASTAADVLLHFAWAPYRPRRRFHWPVIARTWRTSTGYLGNTALYYLNMNLDVLLIGRHLGAAPLGFYQNARSLTDEIRARIAMPIQHVMFPALSALQDDAAQCRQLVLRAGRLVAAVVVPVGFGVSANAQELVMVLYGAQWLPMVPVMAMFGLSAALRAGTAIGSPLFNARDRVGLALRYNSVGTLLTIGAVLVAMPHGIEAVAGAVALTSLYALVALRAALGLVGLGLRHIAQMLGAPLAASLVMWAVTAASRNLEWTRAPASMLLTHVAAGAVVYVATLQVIAPQFGRDIRDALRLLLRRS